MGNSVKVFKLNDNEEVLNLEKLISKFNEDVNQYEDSVFQIIFLRNEVKIIQNSISSLIDGQSILIDSYRKEILILQNFLNYLFGEIKRTKNDILNFTINKLNIDRDSSYLNQDIFRIFYTKNTDDGMDILCVPFRQMHNILRNKNLNEPLISLTLPELMLNIHHHAKKKFKFYI